MSECVGSDTSQQHFDESDNVARPGPQAKRPRRRCPASAEFAAVAVYASPLAADDTMVHWLGGLLIFWEAGKFSSQLQVHQQAERRCIRGPTHCIDYRVLQSAPLERPVLASITVAPMQAPASTFKNL